MKKKTVEWLETQSMLHNAGKLAKNISGNSCQWERPYAEPQSEEVVEKASTWFTAYPPSTITGSETMLEALADEYLWKTFKKIGIQTLHTGPMKLAGGIEGTSYTPTVDGWFDRISLTVDPHFGTDEQYKKLCETAKKYNGIVAGDIIPGHTGKGADFRLAEMGYKDYPGIYHIIEIKKEDWNLLPDVPEKQDSVNLSSKTVNILKEKKYITGHLQRILFSVPGVTDNTAWDATREVKGVDGKIRRWVYLHYFKPGQPTMNWLDPSFAANRVIVGDIIKTIDVLGATVVRLDANPFLGIEVKPDSEKCWSEGHPLSVSATNLISGMVRKLGGWSFQELNLTLDAVRAFSEYGADLSYDFITRPAYQHAILTGDASFLKLTLQLMRDYNIKPVTLIHALQNHDEITYELVHFNTHAKDNFKFKGKDLSGKDLRCQIRHEMETLAIGERSPYNRLSGNGLCTTLTGLAASALGITDIYNMTADNIEKIKKAHLLMVLYNAMQPGVFACSGWDLLGALPLKCEQIEELLADGDYRWINRGAYDLLDTHPSMEESKSRLPRAEVLYGSISEQLKDPDSFVSRLKHILEVRSKYKIYKAEQISLPVVKNDSVVAMLHKLPENLGLQLTILNFGQETVIEQLELDIPKGINISQSHFEDLNRSIAVEIRELDRCQYMTGNCTVKNILDAEDTCSNTLSDGKLNITLQGMEGKVFIFKNPDCAIECEIVW